MTIAKGEVRIRFKMYKDSPDGGTMPAINRGKKLFLPTHATRITGRKRFNIPKHYKRENFLAKVALSGNEGEDAVVEKRRRRSSTSGDNTMHA